MGKARLQKSVSGMERILITGGGGFIGSHLARHRRPSQRMQGSAISIAEHGPHFCPLSRIMEFSGQGIRRPDSLILPIHLFGPRNSQEIFLPGGRGRNPGFVSPSRHILNPDSYVSSSLRFQTTSAICISPPQKNRDFPFPRIIHFTPDMLRSVLHLGHRPSSFKLFDFKNTEYRSTALKPQFGQ